jgi:hypothetical protein
MILDILESLLPMDQSSIPLKEPSECPKNTKKHFSLHEVDQKQL